jgi:hypothetical protein
MTFFEFLMVLVGLVGAIAISVILTYLGHVTRNWLHVKNPTLFLLLAFWLIVNVIGHLSGIWAYRFVDLEVTSSIFIVIAPVIFFTLAVTTLVPSSAKDDEEIDLDVVYFATSRSVFFYLAVHELAALGADYLPGVVNAPPALFMLFMVVIFLIGMFTKHKGIHYGLLLVVIAVQAIPFVFPVYG